MSIIRNIIIFLVIAVVAFLVYFYFIKPPSEQAGLVSAPITSGLPNIDGSMSLINTTDKTSVTKDFLALLLNVRNIKLDDSIFSDPAFASLRDSSITLSQDGTEGRPNPFAQFGNDSVPEPVVPTTLPDTSGANTTDPNSLVLPDVPANPIPPICTLPKVLDTATNTCVTPAPTCTLPKVLDTKTNTCVTPPAKAPDTTKATTHFTDHLNITSLSPTSAKVGATLTVTGVGFSKTGNSFYFYSPDTNESANVKNLTSTDGTKLTVVVPTSLTAHAYTTYVINLGGASNSLDFTVLP
jgi:hypothetical protein